jgi:hypothetical protein
MVWFNVLSALLAGAELNLHLLQQVIGASAYPVLMFGVIMGNLLLRAITNSGLYIIKPPSQ